ncbi:phosphatase 2C-like domain-containing protein [Zopfochytrium polystomum]|nr:phosphatase 2C-like domain-containing protein [Zopfochytrium polystomum]
MARRGRRGNWSPSQIEADELEAFCIHTAHSLICSSDTFSEYPFPSLSFLLPDPPTFAPSKTLPASTATSSLISATLKSPAPSTAASASSQLPPAAASSSAKTPLSGSGSLEGSKLASATAAPTDVAVSPATSLENGEHSADAPKNPSMADPVAPIRTVSTLISRKADGGDSTATVTADKTPNGSSNSEAAGDESANDEPDIDGDGWGTTVREDPDDEGQTRAGLEIKEWTAWSGARAVASKVAGPKTATMPRRKSLKNILLPKRAATVGTPATPAGKAGIFERDVLVAEIEEAVTQFLEEDFHGVVSRLQTLVRRPVPEYDASSYRGLKSNNEDRILILNPIEQFAASSLDPSYIPSPLSLNSLNSSNESLGEPTSPRFRLPSKFSLKTQRSSSPSSPLASPRFGRSTSNGSNSPLPSDYFPLGSPTSQQLQPSQQPTSGQPHLHLHPHPHQQTMLSSSPPTGNGFGGRSSRSGRSSATPSSPAPSGPQNSDCPYSFFAVYDGHGGESVADFVTMHLHSTLLKHASFPSNIPLALKDAFITTNERFKRSVLRENQVINSGSTATVAVLSPGTLHVAWAGDSPAFLVMEDGSAEMLIRPHHSQDEAERKRIEALGGVFLRDGDNYRLNGSVTVTRSFGDLRIPCMTAEPEVVTRALTGRERYLILSSDGLTDVMTPSEIGSYVAAKEERYRKKLAAATDSLGDREHRSSAQKMPTVSKPNQDYHYKIPVGLAELLAQESVDAKGSVDNVSVVIVRLK